MKIDILTLFPEVFSSVLDTSIIGRAKEKGILELNYMNIRDYTLDKHNRVDDYPYGGGAGMLLKTQPLYYAYEDILSRSQKRPKTVYMSPRGRVFNQEIAKELSKEEHIVLICGHYEGIDQRVIDEICDYELSIGDFVLTGGELGAMIVTDAVSRLVPGVLSSDVSYEDESHYNGLLEYPQYTRPPVFHNQKVPDVLLSGNQKEIEKFRKEKSLELTKKVRPDLFALSGIEYNPVFPEIYVPDVKFKLDIVCNSVEMEKIKSLIMLQLEKRGLAENVTSQNYEAKVIVSCCGRGKIEDEDVPVLLCGYLIENSVEKPDFGFRYDVMPESVSLSAVEISGEIFKFLMSVKIKRDGWFTELISQKYSKLEFVNKIPYELYENHIEKLKEFSCDDVYIVKHEKETMSGYVTMICDRDGINLIEGKAFDIKSKKYGKLSLFCSKDLGIYFKEVVLKKNIASEFKCINGKFGEVFINAATVSGDEVCLPRNIAGDYEKKHKYRTVNIEFFV